MRGSGAGVAPYTEEELQVTASSWAACPVPCQPLHRLRFPPPGMTEEEFVAKCEAMSEDEIDAWIDSLDGTECRLCGNVVPMSFWVTMWRLAYGYAPVDPEDD